MRTLGLALAAAMLAAAAPAPPDLSGVWQAVAPPRALTTLDGEAPPLLPAAKAIYDANRAAARRGDRSFDPAARCLPPGIPRLALLALPFEILQKPGTVYFLYQDNRLPRRAYVGEAHPPGFDPNFLGHSTARWEGAELVVDTVGLNDQTLLDPSGLPHSDALHVVERYRLRPGGRLEARITVEDPKTYARPWTFKVSYRRRPGYAIPEEVCADRPAAAG